MSMNFVLTENELVKFLKLVNKDFPKPITEKVELNSYAEKLITKAHLCFVTENQQIVALVAGYNKETINNIGYIAIVAVVKDYRGNGLASTLVKQFIEDCRNMNLAGVHLYANASNTIAIHMYEEIGFEKYEINDEPRPNDIHLIYWIKR